MADKPRLFAIGIVFFANHGHPAYRTGTRVSLLLLIHDHRLKNEGHPDGNHAQRGLP